MECGIQSENAKARLKADPCVYTRSQESETAIITIWVDDLLLFVNSSTMMEKMKDNIQAEWETTDIGEPSKIVGIEITLSKGRISITQAQNIKKILTCYVHRWTWVESFSITIRHGPLRTEIPSGSASNWEGTDGGTDWWDQSVPQNIRGRIVWPLSTCCLAGWVPTWVSKPKRGK